MKEYIVIGNGGYSKIVIDLITKIGGRIVQVCESDNEYKEQLFPNAEIVIAIGNNEIRQRIASKVKHKHAILIHPTAVIAGDVKLGEGSVILANTVLQANVQIGNFVIVQSNATIDHEVILEDFGMIYPGAYIGGKARITVGKTILPNEVVERFTVV